MRNLKLIVAIVVMALGFSGCDPDPDYPTTASISGEYVGTVKLIGYTNPPERAHATLSWMSSDVVLFSLSCEAYKLNLSPVNLVFEEKSGIYTLTPESIKNIEGSITNGVLTVTFGAGGYTYMFRGKMQ